MFENASLISALPNKIKLVYTDFKIINQAALITVVEAKPHNSQLKHAINILNLTKGFQNETPNSKDAAFFCKNLLQLQLIYPNSIMINTFQICQAGKQISCATFPHYPLSSQLKENEGARYFFKC